MAGQIGGVVPAPIQCPASPPDMAPGTGSRGVHQAVPWGPVGAQAWTAESGQTRDGSTHDAGRACFRKRGMLK